VNFLGWQLFYKLISCSHLGLDSLIVLVEVVVVEPSLHLASLLSLLLLQLLSLEQKEKGRDSVFIPSPKCL
jgi:hypothetical protein